MIDSSLIAFVNLLADASGDIIRRYFRHTPQTESKSDLTPVTIADKETETILRTLIQQHYPQHGIAGEEFPPHQGDAEWLWVLDPIDGTKSFIAGRPWFATLIGLTHRGDPVLGVIDQPITHERWIGDPQRSCTLNNQPTRTSGCTQLAEAIIATTGPTYFNEEDWQRYQHIMRLCRFPIWGGDCYNYAMLATGTVDLVIESGLKPHDMMALAAVVNASGGFCCDWQGTPITYSSSDRIIAAATKELALLAQMELAQKLL
ncbi:MAG: inositol monophosphatase family protein [Alphaproteobacteria bacterium]|nr:inositol monophosphatase family protein [Alphaproteobacteria bacterium]